MTNPKRIGLTALAAVTVLLAAVLWSKSQDDGRPMARKNSSLTGLEPVFRGMPRP